MNGSRPRAEWIACAALAFLVFLAAHLPSLATQQWEWDEIIYVSVAKNLLYNGAYSLQGTDVLAQLPPAVYDKPFFHHPPLGIFMMVPAVAFCGDRAAVVVSWIGHLLLVAGVGMWLWVLLCRVHAATMAAVLFLVAIDPLAHFVSQKIWLDALLGGLVTLATGLVLLATVASTRDGERACLFAAGVALGLAVLTKLTALVIVPVVGLLLLLRKPSLLHRERLATTVAWLAVPCLILCVPWFVKFYAYYHRLWPDWLAPDATMLATNEFTRMVANRSWAYFFWGFLALNPWLLVPLVRLQVRERDQVLAWVWLLWILGVFSAATRAGHAVEMRYVTMAIAPAYILLGVALKRWHFPRNVAAFGLVLAIVALSAATSFFYVLRPDWAEIFSLAEIVLRR